MPTLLSQILASGAGGRVFGLDIYTLQGIGIQLFNAAFLAAVLSFLLYKPVQKFMQKRRDTIQNQLNEAQTAMEKANTLQNQYNQLLAELENERVLKIEAASKIAREKGAMLLDEARKEADEIKERGSADAQREYDQIKGELSRYIMDVSAAMTEKCVAHVIDEQTQSKLFDETIAELEEMTWPS